MALFGVSKEKAEELVQKGIDTYFAEKYADAHNTLYDVLKAEIERQIDYTALVEELIQGAQRAAKSLRADVLVRTCTQDKFVGNERLYRLGFSVYKKVPRLQFKSTAGGDAQ